MDIKRTEIKQLLVNIKRFWYSLPNTPYEDERVNAVVDDLIKFLEESK